MRNIADEIFEDMQFPNDGVAFCTDIERNLGVSSDNWIG